MKRRIMLFLSLLVLISVVLFVYITRPSALPLNAGESAHTFRICTANINYSNRQPFKLSKALVSTKADIFVIPEWQGSNLDLEKFSRSSYKVVLNHPQPGTHGIALIAKQALNISASIIASPVKGPCAMPWATAEIKTDSGVFALLGVHAPPPLPVCENTTDPTLNEIANMIKGGKLVRDLGSARAGTPVIVAGDLNAFSFNRAVAKLRVTGLIDTYVAASGGYGPTWSPFSWLPSLFRIDYILASHIYTPHASYTIQLPGSDHRAVVSDLQI